ncbi:MAG: hypothetical protein RLP09_03495 [Sandaracinaceae bacterium]
MLIGCGGAEPAAEPAVDATAGAEVEAPPPRPTGPPMSHATAEHDVRAVIDMERVRSSSLSDDIGSAVRGYPTWRELLGDSGIDPVRDFDRVLVTASGSMAGDGVMLVRHNMTSARVREAVLNMSVERGERPSWRQEGGFDVVDWPADTDPPRLVVITADNEIAVTTAAALPHVLEVARDHQLRREGDETIEPAMTLEDGVIISANASNLSAATTRRIQHPPESIELVLRDDEAEEGRVHLEAQGSYADDASAGAAATWFREQRDFYAGQMLVRAVGLDRPLREAEIGAEGSRVDLRASFTEEELERVLGLLALQQMGGG